MRLALVALVACAYRPGSFTDPGQAWIGPRATVGCLDLALERRVDLPIGPVVRYQFANRCDRPLTIDLGAVIVVGRAADGAERALAPYDPASELHAAALEARSAGAEALAYPAAGPMPQVCVDAATLVHATPARWICLGAPAVVGSAP
jgi:hypothetical protein